MMGKHHVTVNALIGGAALSLLGLGFYTPGEKGFGYQVQRTVLNYFYPEQVRFTDVPFAQQTLVFLFFSSLFFWFGTLLPDIDSKSSILGSHLHLPLKHRTWTHSVWALLLVFLVSLAHPWFRLMPLGFALHLLGDAFSASGLCFFYPFQRYIAYDSGAFVAPGHTWKLYHAGKQSEAHFVLLVSIPLLVVIAYFGVYRQGLWSVFQWVFG